MKSVWELALRSLFEALHGIFDAETGMLVLRRLESEVLRRAAAVAAALPLG